MTNTEKNARSKRSDLAAQEVKIQMKKRIIKVLISRTNNNSRRWLRLSKKKRERITHTQVRKRKVKDTVKLEE